MPRPRCDECLADSVDRPASWAGQVGGRLVHRCATHARMARNGARMHARALRLARTYNLTLARYEALYEAQGGVCAGCGPRTGRTGKSKALAVDHDHRCCPGPVSCGECVRGLLCSECNQYIGRHRDDPASILEEARRLANYLILPPAKSMDHETRIRTLERQSEQNQGESES